jgi:membrane protein
VDRLRRWVDRKQADHAWMAVPVATVKKFGEDRAGNLAALLAYYGFFSIFPLLLVLVSVVGFVLASNEQLQGDILDSALAESTPASSPWRSDSAAPCGPGPAWSRSPRTR